MQKTKVSPHCYPYLAQHLPVHVCVAVLTAPMLCSLAQCPQPSHPSLQHSVPSWGSIPRFSVWFLLVAGNLRILENLCEFRKLVGKVRLPPFPAESPVADPECFPSSGCLWLAANVSPGAFKNLSQDTQGAAGRVVWQHVKIANVIAQSVCCCGGICCSAHMGAGPEGPGMVAGGKGHPMKQ